MPAAEFFTHLGFYVVPDFLDTELCREIVACACRSDWSPAVVYRGPDALQDEESRRTLSRRVPKVRREEVRERLAALGPSLEAHFHLSLFGFEEPQVLRYRTNDFFRAHRDSTADPDGRDLPKQRRLSVTLFLNDESEEPVEGTYSGGSLVFYGILPDARAQQCGFPLKGRAGSLVAFPSEVLHEVKPVLRGERFSVVSWYAEAQSDVLQPLARERHAVGAGT